MTRAALITGGSSGIGLACARKLVELGYNVAICGRDEGRLAAAQVDCGAEIAITCDVGDRVAVQRFVDAAVDRFGGLDVVVANAGDWRGGPIEELRGEDWDAVLRTNLNGTFYTAAATLAHLRARAGYIFVIASISAFMSAVGFAAYSSSKAGLRGLSFAIREEVAGQGVRVTVISPGYVDTPFLGAEERARDGLLSPTDIAETVAWCLRLSPAAVVRDIVIEDSGGPWTPYSAS